MRDAPTAALPAALRAPDGVLAAGPGPTHIAREDIVRLSETYFWACAGSWLCAQHAAITWITTPPEK